MRASSPELLRAVWRGPPAHPIAGAAAPSRRLARARRETAAHSRSLFLSPPTSDSVGSSPVIIPALTGVQPVLIMGTNSNFVLPRVSPSFVGGPKSPIR